jgi:hypothetical protein
LEAKTLFEMLQEQRSEPYAEGQLRTLQRRVKQWRAIKGPDKAVFFSQEHRPGEAAQTDFTHGTELGVTIDGVAFGHMLCHFVLPYSNWQWATVCMSESLLSLRRGVQAALFRLGHHPTWHQTVNSTAATHTVGERKRKFNAEYESITEHFGMKLRTISVGAKEQNGDVEALNRALKQRIKQRLLVRGSQDFEGIETYETWLGHDPLKRANAGRRERLAHEIAIMPAVRVSRRQDVGDARRHALAHQSATSASSIVLRGLSRPCRESVGLRLARSRKDASVHSDWIRDRAAR